MTNRRRMDDAYISIRPRSSDCGCVYGCLASSVRSRLSLSQRERMKVRDCFAVAPRVRTRLLATHYRALGESDDSRISTRQLHGEPEIPSAFGREFGLYGSYVLRRPIRWPALRSDNRNPRRSRPADVGDETYSLQNFGSVNVAKEYVPARSPSFAAIERDSQQFILTINASSEKHFRIPSPQSSPRKRGEADTSICF